MAEAGDPRQVQQSKPKSRYRNLNISVTGNNQSVYKMSSNVSQVKRKAEFKWDTTCKDLTKTGGSIKMKFIREEVKIEPTAAAARPKKPLIDLPEGLLESQHNASSAQNQSLFPFLSKTQEPQIIPEEPKRALADASQPQVSVFPIRKRKELYLKVPAFAFPTVSPDEMSPPDPPNPLRLPYFALHKRSQLEERLGIDTVYPRACFEFLSTGKCTKGRHCDDSHILPSTLKISQQLVRMKAHDVRQLFFVYVQRCEPMLRHLFATFALSFGQKKMVEPLFQMLIMSENPERKVNTVQHIDIIFRGLLSAGLSYADILVNVLINCRNATDTLTSFVLSLNIGTRITRDEFYKVIQVISEDDTYLYDAQTLNILLPIASQTNGVEIIRMVTMMNSKLKLMSIQGIDLSTTSQETLQMWLNNSENSKGDKSLTKDSNNQNLFEDSDSE